MQILVVDDDLDLLEELTHVLQEEKYKVDTAADGEQALDKLFEHLYDIVLLDIMLPKIDGLTVLKEMRQNQINTPVLMLTAKGDVDDKIKGLDSGADDYLAKPFDMAELMARIRALLSRSGENKDIHLRIDAIDLNTKTRQVTKVGKPIEELDEDIVELIQSIAVGLLATTIFLVWLSYMIAGKVLKPIRTINSLAREINDKTLNKRIPLGEHQDELYMLASSLNQMFDRLQYSFQRQKEFIASASHELKTPITLLLIFMEGAIHRENLPAKFRQRLIRHTDILRRMRRLVKNLLDLSILELKDSVESEKVCLFELVQFVVEEYQEVFAAKKINLELDLTTDVNIVGDRERLQRCLINLVDNALKYNVDGGEIKIKLFEEEDDKVHLSLFNTGPGIPRDDLERVFEQFYRVEKSRSLQYGGSGLGLCIVKRIIELHGGKIYIESEQGAWTRVHIILPKTRRG